MKKALVIHGDIYGFGGAENHAIKIIKILEELDFDVTVLHAGGALDAPRIHKQVGISLDPVRVRFQQAQVFVRHPTWFENSLLMRYAFVLREARGLAESADLVVGTYGETPLEARVLVQSMHIPLFFFDRESLGYLGVQNPKRLMLAIRKAYVLAARLIGGWSRQAVERGVMLTNSKWTGAQFRRHYPAGRVETIYHGAHTRIDSTSPQYLPFEERANTVVLVGRVVPFKRVHLAIEIVDGLRARGHAVELLIIGGGGGAYADSIAEMLAARPHAQWRRDLPRDDMEQLIARQRWGLHCAEFEHYGLAPLELQRLGCVTFVHDSGGQAEAVSDDTLKYRDVDDAIRNIDQVMTDKDLAFRLFAALPKTVAAHEPETHREAFVERLRQLGVHGA